MYQLTYESGLKLISLIWISFRSFDLRPHFPLAAETQEVKLQLKHPAAVISVNQ